MNSKSKYYLHIAAGSLALAASASHAVPLISEGALQVEGDLAASTVAVISHNANFGLGRLDLRNGKVGDQKNSFHELSVQPGLTASYKQNEDLTWLGAFSVVGNTTQGGSDPGGYTRSGDGRVSVERAYTGFQSGNWKVLGGSQNFLVGSGFILADGNVDAFGEGGYWSAPRRAFRDALTVQWANDSLSAQFFSLRAKPFQGDVRITGFNGDYALGGYTQLGAMAFKVDSLDSKLDAFQPREGMTVYNIRALNIKLPGMQNFTFNSESAWQRGSNGEIEYDANAWYAGGAYDLPWFTNKTTLSYRYAEFSGDDDLTDNNRKGWDALTKGFTDWDTWLIGDVIGNYVLFNSNEKVHSLHLKTQLNQSFTIGSLYHQFSLDQKNFSGIPVTDKRFADEITAYAQWTPTPNWYVIAAYNVATPKTGAKEALGNEDFDSLEFYVALKY